jgi:hypothetical protein
LPITYSPGDRYAVLGMSGTGKTVFVVTLSALLVPAYADESDWQCWWLDTKDDPADIAMLHEWGFREPSQRTSGRASSRLIYYLRGSREDVYEQAQGLSDQAMARRGILLVYDEYNHVTKSRQDAGPAVEDVHKRGRGLDVGMCGGVQEPVLVPRFLFSQAIHRALFGLEHLPDIKIARELCPKYAKGWPDIRDITTPHTHGFWLRSGPQGGDDNSWHYWPHVAAWHNSVTRPASEPCRASSPVLS